MSQPWPDGTEPGNPGGLETGTVKADGLECAREWPAGAPGHGYYDPPAAVPPGQYPLEVTGVTPDHGSTAGGEQASVYGASFDSAIIVTFGGVQAGGVALVTPEELACTVPPGALGPADVTVQTAAGSATLTAGWTYETPAAPVTIAASFTYTPAAPTTQDNVTFDGSASTPGAGQTITGYAWLFNNQTTRSGQVVTWRLPSGHGEYDATLTVTDSGGGSDSLTQVLVI